MARSEWKNPTHFKRCDGKRGFRSMATAEIEAERASAKTGELIIAYTCLRLRPGPHRSCRPVSAARPHPHIDRPC
jgi:hypothetical protein